MSLPLAVFKRFGEHGGGRLATTVSYWAFFSIFPLLLVFVTVLNVILADDPDTRQDLVDGALGQVPVIGTELGVTDPLGGSWTTVAIGVLVAIWSGLAAANALQTAVEEIWDTPGYERPNVAVHRLRSMAFLVIFGVGLVLSTLALDVGALRRPRPARHRRRHGGLVPRRRRHVAGDLLVVHQRSQPSC